MEKYLQFPPPEHVRVLNHPTSATSQGKKEKLTIYSNPLTPPTTHYRRIIAACLRPTRFTRRILAVSRPASTVLYLLANLDPSVNVYHITDYCPLLFDPLGFSGPASTVYFDRTDVKNAIHAPHKQWEACTFKDVFVGEDRSPE